MTKRTLLSHMRMSRENRLAKSGYSRIIYFPSKITVYEKQGDLWVYVRRYRS